MSKAEEKYWLGLLNEFIGATVNDVEMDEDSFIGISFTMKDGKLKHIWLLSDEEGNDPGRVQVFDG